MNTKSHSFFYGILKSDNLIYNLTNNQTTIGRNPEVNIVLSHPSISLEQAIIKFDHNNTPFIIDLNSSNGTWLNNSKLSSNIPTKLDYTDKITFGNDTIEYTVEPYNSSIVGKTIKFPASINDDIVNLVNLDTYQGATMNHFEKKNMNTISFRDSANVFSVDSPKFYSNSNEDTKQRVNNEDTLMLSTTLKESQDDVKPSIYQDIFKSNNIFEKQMKDKSNEINNLSSIYEHLNENYNKLNAKHNAVLVYASNLQKKNDYLLFQFKEKTEALNLSNQSDLGLIIKEKDVVVQSLMSDNHILKKEIENLINANKSSNLANSNRNNNNNMNNDKLLSEYIAENNKLKQIISHYQTNNNECSRKWNELIQTNKDLTNQLETVKREKNEEAEDCKKKINEYDKRIQSILTQIPIVYDKFNLKKEEAAQFLVDQVKIYLEEKEKMIKEKSILQDKLKELNNQNDKLNQRISKYEGIQQSSDGKYYINRITELEDLINEMRIINNEENKVEYEAIIKRQFNEITAKDKLIKEMKDNYDKICNGE